MRVFSIAWWMKCAVCWLNARYRLTVSPYHPLLLRRLRGHRDDLIPLALGLSTTGNDVLQCYRQIVLELIDQVVFPETCQAVYGLGRPR